MHYEGASFPATSPLPPPLPFSEHIAEKEKEASFLHDDDGLLTAALKPLFIPSPPSAVDTHIFRQDFSTLLFHVSNKVGKYRSGEQKQAGEKSMDI